MKKDIVLSRFLDDEGRVTVFPKRGEKRDAVLEYLADKFEEGREYSEREVNELCDRWSTINDCFLLRREMIEARLLERTRDGSRYWRQVKRDE